MTDTPSTSSLLLVAVFHLALNHSSFVGWRPGSGEDRVVVVGLERPDWQDVPSSVLAEAAWKRLLADISGTQMEMTGSARQTGNL